MSEHTWDDPEIFQIWNLKQANQNRWLKENQKKWPIKVNHEGVTLSQSACVSIHMYCTLLFLLINTYFTTFPLCGNYFYAKLKVQGLVTDHRSSGKDSALIAASWPQSLVRNWGLLSSCGRSRPSEIKKGQLVLCRVDLENLGVYKGCYYYYFCVWGRPWRIRTMKIVGDIKERTFPLGERETW